MSDSKLLVADVSNGLYETKAGRPVFYVRGEVDNRSGQATKAEVVIELMRGDTVVRTGAAWAGGVPTPEELYLLSSPDDLEALQTQLQKRAGTVGAGTKAPFAFAVFEYPARPFKTFGCERSSKTLRSPPPPGERSSHGLLTSGGRARL